MTASKGGKPITTTPHPSPPSEKEAGWILKRMAPPKGGTEPPDATFLAVAALICGAGYYAWFIEPPHAKQKDESKEEQPAS